MFELMVVMRSNGGVGDLYLFYVRHIAASNIVYR
jgi:hypothetical protein